MSGDREHRIRERAHAIWESQGRPHGADRDHWDQATKEIEAEGGPANGSTLKKPARAPAKPRTKATAAAPKSGEAPAAKKTVKTKAVRPS
jgi:hypothetical protein